MRKILATFVVGCALLAVFPAASGSEHREIIAAHDLRRAFADDQNAAETQYLGKTILVQGVVLTTGMSIYLTPTVTLSDREGGSAQVICVLPRLDAGKLSDFKPGQRAVMSGRVHRLTERGVILKECKAVE